MCWSAYGYEHSKYYLYYYYNKKARLRPVAVNGTTTCKKNLFFLNMTLYVYKHFRGLIYRYFDGNCDKFLSHCCGPSIFASFDTDAIGRRTHCKKMQPAMIKPIHPQTWPHYSVNIPVMPDFVFFEQEKYFIYLFVKVLKYGRSQDIIILL